MNRAQQSGILWCDIGDLLDYFALYSRPSGIQRVVVEVLRMARLRCLPEVRLCRITPGGRLLHLDWSWLDQVSKPPTPPVVAAPGKPHLISVKLATHLRQCAKNAVHLTFACFPGDSGDRFRRWIRPLRIPPARRKWHASLAAAGVPSLPSASDLVVTLGAPWIRPGCEKDMEQVLAQSGARYAVLVYDLIPLTHPHLFPDEPNPFMPWLDWALKRACLVQTISHYSARTIAAYRENRGFPLVPTEVIRLGDPLQASTRAPNPLPPHIRFILCVGTIEARKNHRLLLDTWLILRERLGERCPHLVWAGRKGWLVDDLFTQLRAARWLEGRIIHLPQASDAELETLYRDSLFTVYPSLAEGWGLPVAESLSRGKVCIASNSTSIPEIAGDLPYFIDPFDPRSLAELICRLLDQPAELAAREVRIRETWRAQPWSVCADQVLRGLEETLVLNESCRSQSTGPSWLGQS